MPKAAPRKCTHVGCRALVHDGTSRCPDHQPPAWQKRHEQTKRITGRKLQRMREDLLRREPLCVNCKKHDRIKASTQRDHIVPLAAGGADDETNEQALCDECHAEKTKQESKQFRYRSVK